MTTEAVILVGTSENREMIDLLFEAGFAPIVRRKMEQVLRTLQRGQFAAVVVDGEHVEDDLLEFVLNVSDVAAGMPLVVAGGERDEQDNARLSSRKNVHLVQPEEFCRRLEEIVSRTSGEKQN